jgi:hypothetical protein
MSLEQTLERTNELLAQVITILQTGVAAQTEVAPVEKATRKKKTEVEAPAPTPAPAPAPVAAPAVTTTPNNILGTVEGDPVGTRYWLCTKHNSLYAQRPGDPDCTLPGAVITTAQEYLAKKAEFAALTQAAIANTTVAPEPAPVAAAAGPSAQPVSSPQSAPTQSDVPFPTVVERITALNKSAEPGHGREGVLAVLRKWLPGDEKPTVTKLQPLGKNAEILADIEALLAPKSDDFDPLA